MTVRDAATAGAIRVVAESDTMPRSRTTVTDARGRYSLPQLLPGSYRVTFEASNGAKHTLSATVLLDQATVLSLELDAPSTTDAIEELVVVGKRVARRGQATLANAIAGTVVGGVPLGPDYRDPRAARAGVQVTQDRVRGPSAGGSGQDNVYRFDGVDVSLPMFGTLSGGTVESRHRISSRLRGVVPERWVSTGAAGSRWTPPRSPVPTPSPQASSTLWSLGAWLATGAQGRTRPATRTPTASASS